VLLLLFLWTPIAAHSQEMSWESAYGPKIQAVQAKVESACSINRFSPAAADTVGKDALDQIQSLKQKLITDFQRIQNPSKNTLPDPALAAIETEQKDELDREIEKLDLMRDRVPASDFESQRSRVIHVKHSLDSARTAQTRFLAHAEAQIVGGMRDPESLISYTRTLDQVDALYSKAMGCWVRQMGIGCDVGFNTLGNDGKCWMDMSPPKGSETSY